MMRNVRTTFIFATNITLSIGRRAKLLETAAGFSWPVAEGTLRRRIQPQSIHIYYVHLK